MEGKILVIGAGGQIGTELVEELIRMKGEQSVVAADLRELSLSGAINVQLDVMDEAGLREILKKYNIKEVYHLAALLSATAEQKPLFAWDLNMKGLFNILEAAKDGLVKKVFWPSSIAVYGPSAPANAEQLSIAEPQTVYGISKTAGEQWCAYYHMRYGIDVRSLRYPGLIGHKSQPGGGTTDYAVTIFHDALKGEPHCCFLTEDRRLPMMYMPDAIRATIELMEATENQVKIRTSYNLAAMSFTPMEIGLELKKYFPELEIIFTPDYRDDIAQSWPECIDDRQAQEDWGWKPNYLLEQMVEDMVVNLREKIMKSA